MIQAASVSPLLDVPPMTAAEYVEIEDAYQSLLGTRNNLVVFPGEAILPLEAIARSLGRSEMRCVNLVTGPYGILFGNWLAAGGAEVHNVTVFFNQSLPPLRVEEELATFGPVDVVSLVHAEAATGVVNNLPLIAAAAREAGALVVVDAVASVGAEPLEVDEWGLDLVVLGAHKALSGPSGATGAIVSDRAWDVLSAGKRPLRNSSLSLLDWRDRWVDAGRNALPTIPPHLETRALGDAIARVEAEGGLSACVERHQRAAAAARVGLAPLGLEPWVQSDEEAANVVTLVTAPNAGTGPLLAEAGASTQSLVPALSPAPGGLRERAVRIDHTGRRANLAVVLDALTSLAHGMAALDGHPDLPAALAAAQAAWSGELSAGLMPSKG